MKKLQQVEALFNEVGTGGVDITRAMEKAISTAEEMVKTVESEAESLIGKTLTFFFLSSPKRTPKQNKEYDPSLDSVHHTK